MMKKKPAITNEPKPSSRPLSGRFTPHEASPGRKTTKKPTVAKKTRYVTPNPFSPKSATAKPNGFPKEGTCF